MLYFSYAVNLNRSHMARLCPGAEPLYAAVLEGYTLTVRQWFNIEPDEGGVVHGGVWRVGEECLPFLDSYEDCPHLYTKKVMEIRVPLGQWNVEARRRQPTSLKLRRSGGYGGQGGKWRGSMEGMVYLMRQPFVIPFSPPDPEYLQMVRHGYREWGIPDEQLEAILKSQDSGF